jgi:flagellar assembly protein FliH
LSGNILAAAREEAGRIVSAAEADAERELAAAREESERIRREAELDGRERGYADGLADARDEADKLRAEAENALSESIRRRDEIIAEAEPRLVGLIAEICESIVGGAVRFGGDAILAMIRKGLSDKTITGVAAIRVSKSRYGEIAGRMDELSGAAGGAKLELTADPSFEDGDAVIETPFGSVDVSADTQLETLKRNLFAIMGGGDDGG